ncbi:MAG: GGDEF domain-containing protein [Thermoanaerobaculia bacterium]
MSRETDAAALRILSPLSALIRKTLRIVDGEQTDRADAFSVHLSLPDLSIVSVEGGPFSNVERDTVRAVFEVIHSAEENSVRLDELQKQMRRLERDNYELIIKNRILSEVSARDSLTGLYNRWYVVDKIEAEINRSLRHGSPMSIMMLDIDHFKRVNDTYGHPAGDLVLQSVGKLLKESCRVYDVPGRYGGEEFCILFPQINLEMAPNVPERIRQRLEMTELELSGSQVAVTASIGIASVDAKADDQVLSPAALIDRADRALYSAKHRGRNRVEFWDSNLSFPKYVEPEGH